ncbi:hypothetical protein CAPTEDRAFT_225721 [Capitella teleta]|uniref:Cadherin domain-containing protein n=1 Tax=Capitella teleta TaxID=283909 RepID=R7UYB5_CAPTE|nr:hypothetical protein CAPTEDRAFT_225721 [Capitella teleta]|eukprot:ELU08937.1 hypothetical protein CAPTEDRAFT_225721 [Capitella teleta]
MQCTLMTKLGTGRFTKPAALSQETRKMITLLISVALFGGTASTASIPGLDGEDPRDGIQEPKPYYIVEQLAVNTPVGSVPIDARLSQRFSPEELSQISFHFISQKDDQGVDLPLFDIDKGNGIIKTGRVIDRDAICPHQIQCLVHLLVGLSPAEFFLEIRIIVDIIDLNDNRPVFSQPEILRQISEAASLSGARINIPTAHDPDSPAYGIDKYELISSSDRFHLEKDSSGTGLKIVVQPLDREEFNFYQFTVVAYDGGDPPKSASMLVDIEVLDSNDNEPKFDNATFEIFVLESLAANTTIGRVSAVDKDAGDRITYRFTQQTLDRFGGLFGLEPHSGSIYLKQKLDYEQGDMYILTLTANDGASQALATVYVKVEDSNDNAPQITVNTLTENGIAKISESAEIGTFVAHVTARDLDTGDNGRLECALDNGHFEMEALRRGEFKVLTATQLNREVNPTFHVQVLCHDRGVQRKTSSAAIDVQVLDSNDHSPEFTSDLYVASIRENNYINDVIITVHADDADYGLNGDVTYDLHSNAKSLFKIHPKRGEITANAVFDRETMHSFTFGVIAFDLGAPRRSATSSVQVRILDENDEQPEFLEAQYAFGIYENGGPGMKVGEVLAQDKDGEGNNEFTFRIIKSMAGTRPEEAFEINAKTGLLRTTIALDRETNPVYYLAVQVTSKRGVFPQTSSTVSVTVYVADKNDNDPILDWPTERNSTVQVPSQLKSGDLVAHIRAHDIDIGDNGKLVYSINHDQVTERVFDINPSTGDITLRKDLTGLNDDMYNLAISVSDKGHPQRRTETMLSVTLNDTMGRTDKPPGVIITNHNTTIIISLTSAFLILVFLVFIVVFLLKKTLQEYKKSPVKVSTSCALPQKDSHNMLYVRDDGRQNYTEPSTSYQLYSNRKLADYNEIEVDASPNRSLKRSNIQPECSNQVFTKQSPYRDRCSNDNERNSSKMRRQIEV